MSDDEFADSFPAENEYVERKSGAGAALQDIVVAFSNTDGGVVLIGVDDGGRVIGRALTPGLEDDIHRVIRETASPGRYTIHELGVGSTTVVVLAVARRIEGFAQTSQGRTLVRRGTQNVALFGSELSRFLHERALARFEETETRSLLESAEDELVREVARAFGWTTDVSDRLREQGLLTPDGRRLTVAGALYLLADPAEALGKAYVEVLRFPAEGGDYDKRLELRGPANRQVENAVDAVVAELGTELVVLGLHRFELPRVPTVVLREAFANAVAHRSYELRGTPVRVELHPAEVRVISPGGLPEPVTVENIRETTAARNMSVIQTLRRFGLAEDVGRGVDVMEDSMREELLDPPLFEDSGSAVTVTLRIRSAVTPQERAWIREVESRGLIEPGDRFLLVHAARGERLTNARARQILGVDADEARRALQRLRDGGFLDQVGERSGTWYSLRDSLHPPAGLRLSAGELEELVLADAREPGAPRLTNARVRELTGLDRVDSLRVLDSLVDQGRLRREGSKRGTFYLPN